MEVLSSSTSLFFSLKPLHKTRTRQLLQIPIFNTKTSLSSSSSFSSSCFSHCITSAMPSSSVTSSPISTASSENRRHWIVLTETPPKESLNSKSEIVDFYVNTLQRVLGDEKDSQMCIYDVSLENHFGFCCDIDEQTSIQLSRLPGILSVMPDPDFQSVKKNYDPSNVKSRYKSGEESNEPRFLFPKGTTKYWLVRMDKPGIEVVSKAQMVDHYAQILAKVLGNEKDAQMCIYHVSWESNFGFCCELDEDCAKELAGVPGVLTVQPDKNFESVNKDYAGNNNEEILTDSSGSNEAIPVKTKKLFVTGLSFYTSEKTLRAAFEGFGELVEVRIIMDKISKRSKGYAFIEYSTEEAASEARKEMNGKIINGWMIVVDAAKPKSSPPRNVRGRIRQS